MINASDTVTLCVGGQTFITRRATLYRLPDSRLYEIAAEGSHVDSCVINVLAGSAPASHQTAATANISSSSRIYFYDRDPEIFRFVLDYYRTGELHLPSNICGPFVRKELIFWGLDESFILPCCLPAYMRYEEERRTKKTLFKDCFEDIDSMKNLVECSRGWKRIRYVMWLFLDHPSSSLPARLWATVLLVLMICSVMCYCLATHSAFRSESRNVPAYNESDHCAPSAMLMNQKLKKDCTTEPARPLVIFDVALNVFFTLEFLLKLCLAPDKKKFLQTAISVLDVVILTSYWVYIFLFYHYYYTTTLDQTAVMGSASNTLWLLNILATSQALRILRIFKISKMSRGMRVLMLTVKKSTPELVLLGFLLMNGTFLFSSMIYIAEYNVNDTMSSIPVAFWWSLITLTTVGYGDTYPKSAPGYIVGSIAAISGCIVTGLAIPIVGNNFNTYYKYMQNQLKQDKYLKQLSKDHDCQHNYPPGHPSVKTRPDRNGGTVSGMAFPNQQKGGSVLDKFLNSRKYLQLGDKRNQPNGGYYTTAKRRLRLNTAVASQHANQQPHMHCAVLKPLDDDGTESSSILTPVTATASAILVNNNNHTSSAGNCVATHRAPTALPCLRDMGAESPAIRFQNHLEPPLTDSCVGMTSPSTLSTFTLRLRRKSEDIPGDYV